MKVRPVKTPRRPCRPPERRPAPVPPGLPRVLLGGPLEELGDLPRRAVRAGPVRGALPAAVQQEDGRGRRLDEGTDGRGGRGVGRGVVEGGVLVPVLHRRALRPALFDRFVAQCV
ncbi:hypothetical protein THAOC_10135 [Thalassiosira oceanica]|uniref:Uncharacterized protein n=1 Tax=Thalassiosira oceanica TaxID=159749 RepID=K0STG5_THAOC|nr:hypothetical protein THAOC_10135 [Thalassiosira oceanica]|eukprot:EJK68665.1 hypothetical protein THAOC_10135 [Thalassiosira oceanica]